MRVNEAVKTIKRYCQKVDCEKCRFHREEQKGLYLDTYCMFEELTPSDWTVKANEKEWEE